MPTVEAGAPVVLTVELRDGEAWALAQLVKRIGWSDCRALAIDDEEARLMIAAAERMRAALRDVGFAPR